MLSNFPNVTQRLVDLHAALPQLSFQWIIAIVLEQGEVSKFLAKHIYCPQRKRVLLPYATCEGSQNVSLSTKIAHEMYTGDILAPMNIKDAYLHVPIFLAHQSYMCYAVGTQLYLFVAFSFDLSTALQVFTKM